MKTKHISIPIAFAILLSIAFIACESDDPIGILLQQSGFTNNVTTNELRFQKEFNTSIETLDFEPSVTITDPRNGNQIFCVWMATAYRLSQVAAQVWDDGVFYSSQVKRIETGWNANGGVSFFTDILGIPADRVIIPPDSSPSKDLVLEDAWYEITLDNERAILFQATEALYHREFLLYREQYMNGEPTISLEMVERERDKVKQVLRTLPFADKFKIKEYL